MSDTTQFLNQQILELREQRAALTERLAQAEQRLSDERAEYNWQANKWQRLATWRGKRLAARDAEVLKYRRALETIESNGCFTGDCPHLTKNECYLHLIAAIPTDARTALSAAPSESALEGVLREVGEALEQAVDMFGPAERPDTEGADWLAKCRDALAALRPWLAEREGE